MSEEYDVIVFGAGVAGLWIANRLTQAGYNVIVVEKEKLGSGQTMASQGMIHGGQKYLLQGVLTPHAVAAATMPPRWQASIEGRGEVDLTSVEILSEEQVMWPAGSLVSRGAVRAAAARVNAECRKIETNDHPEPLRLHKLQGPVYALPEKVLEVRSLVLALARDLDGRILRGEVTDLTAEGVVTVSARSLCARLIVFAAGAGNEQALHMLGIGQRLTQRRPLRQVMVRPLPYALFGHGVAMGAQPRVTVTSHAIGGGEYVWYLGGGVAEKGAKMDKAAALRFAASELEHMFPAIPWSDKEWATWYGERAEPIDENGRLPAAPVVRQWGCVLFAWPTKLTFVPALSDAVLGRFKDIPPAAKSPPPPLPVAEVGAYPWEVASWQTVA
jgi:glycine/D-amino acid oxidase-like deaminating enzyme